MIDTETLVQRTEACRTSATRRSSTRRRSNLRGRRVGKGGLALGGGGIGLVVTLLIIFLGGNVTGGGGLGELGNLAGQSAGTPASSEVGECRTGADADEREDCRIVGYVNSIQSYWIEAFRAAGSTRSR